MAKGSSVRPRGKKSGDPELKKLKREIALSEKENLAGRIAITELKGSLELARLELDLFKDIAKLSKSGFSLETMLGLAEEFASYKDARNRLAGVLKTSQSLTRYLTDLKHDSEEKKKAIDSEIGQLLNRKGAEESKLKRLEQTRHQLEINVSRLH